MSDSFDWFDNVATAALLVLATYVVARIMSTLLFRFLRRDDNPLPASSIFVNITRVAIWGIGLSMMLDACFGVNASGIIAALGVGGIAVSLGFQDTIANLIGGLQLSLGRLVEPGEYIDMTGKVGKIRDVTWRQTTIETKEKEIISIPNSLLNKNALIHIPTPTANIVKTPIFLKPGTSLDEATDTITKLVAEAIATIALPDKNPTVHFAGFTEHGIPGEVIVHVDYECLTGDVIDIVARSIAGNVEGLMG